MNDPNYPQPQQMTPMSIGSPSGGSGANVGPQNPMAQALKAFQTGQGDGQGGPGGGQGGSPDGTGANPNMQAMLANILGINPGVMNIASGQTSPALTQSDQTADAMEDSGRGNNWLTWGMGAN